ncbi:hypothetical protein JCM33374_g2738 [Metschnikowia sp. JCM 33374]|nr:hypothetical protein JCM33374_g2738 [Metschnikowia sp. JCM 33374]
MISMVASNWSMISLLQYVCGFLGCLCYSISVNWGNLGASVLIGEVLAVWPLISLSFVSGGGVFAGLKWLKTSDLPRVLWRPHTSVLYRLLHGEEALLVNKVVTYFEEYNEVNVKNFHLSQVRPSPRLNVFDTNDYELFMPEIPGSLQGSVSKENDAATEALTRYFRSELHRRKMVWRPLKEEQMFLDFWVNHGDNYEWVEPDQDPAEMAVLESMCVPTKE